MSTMRLCFLAVIAAGLAAAGYTATDCPETPSHGCFYTNASAACAAAAECDTERANCIGTSSAPDCVATAVCVGKWIKCINKASDDTTACPGLKNLHMSLLGINSGTAYNVSTAYTSCKACACQVLNSTAGNCALDYDVLCQPPVQFRGTLLFRGMWKAILASQSGKSDLMDNFAKDLKFILRVFVKVLNAFIHGSSRRQTGTDSLVVEFVAPGVNDKNPALKERLEILAGKPSFPSVAAQCRNATGEDFTFLGFSAGIGSSAFGGGSLGSVISGFLNSGSNASASASASSSASSSTSSGPSDTTGAATQSLLIAAIVVVISAALF